MDARTNIEARLPNRPVAERFARPSFAALNTFTQPNLFKKPRYIPDSQPGGRHVAKDIGEIAGIPLLMTTVRGRDHLHGDGMTVTGPAVTEILNPPKRKSHADA
jgi:dihydroxyacid dehydratase/phosphogluconate dehydratase